MASVQRVLLVTSDHDLALLLQLEIGDSLPDAGINMAASLPEGLALAKARRPDLMVIGPDGWPVDLGRGLQLLHSASLGSRFILVGKPGMWPQAPGVPVVAELTLPLRLPQLDSALVHVMSEPEVIREDVGMGAEERRLS